MRGSEKKQVPVVRMEDASNRPELDFYADCLEKINGTIFINYPDHVLKAVAADLRNKASQGTHPDLLLPAAFALVREASRRIIGLRPYDVQILAGLPFIKKGLSKCKPGRGRPWRLLLPRF